MMAISIQVSAKHFEFKKKKLMTELLLFDMSILRWMFGNMPKVYKQLQPRLKLGRFGKV